MRFGQRLGLVLLLVAPLWGQPAGTTHVWRHDILGTLNLTQASFSNWQQGGQNSLAWRVQLNTQSTYDSPTLNWTTTGKFEIGFTKVEGQGLRKSTDQINLKTVVTRTLSALNPFFSLTMLTQFADGFQYDEAGVGTQVSKFLDPGYFTESLGVRYAPTERFNTRLGASLKQTVTRDFPAPYADDPATPQLEKVRFEGGVSSVTYLELALHENIAFTASLDLFSDLKALNRVDVFWENALVMKVSRLISVTVNADVLYDRDISRQAQVRQSLGIGVSYAFF